MSREVVKKSNRLRLLITGSIVFSLLIQFLTVVNVSAANAFIDPNGDGSNGGWTVNPAGTAYTTVDEATRQPTVPTTSDYVQSAANSNANLFLQMGTIANVSTVSSITVWAYHNDGSNGVITFALYDDTESTNYGSANFAQRTTSGWSSVTLSGLSLSQAQLDGLRFRFNTTKLGGGQPATITLYATYADVTFTPSGSLSVGIVDGTGSPVGSPSVSFTSMTTDFTCKQSTEASAGTLGTTSQRIRVTNSTGNGNWTLSIAASSTTALWNNGTNQFDFNDTACGDLGDADNKSGALRVDPSVSTLTPQSGCSSSGVTKGSSTAFIEWLTPVTNITLLTASASQTNCYYDLTAVSLLQTIPAETPASASPYVLNMVITVVAN